MKVNSYNSNNLSFQSKIKFVPQRVFREKEIFPFIDCKKRTEPLPSSIIRDREFHTSNIRTCTGGGLVDFDGVLGFHFFDCQENIEKVGNALANIIDFKTRNNKSALLIGSKELPSRPDSVPLFERIRGIVASFVTPSVFKTHSNLLAESSIAYEKAADTWTIFTPLPKCPVYMPDEPFIDSLDSLLAAFKEIKIAPQDSLYIGEKQIQKSDCPRIFD